MKVCCKQNAVWFAGILICLSVAPCVAHGNSRHADAGGFKSGEKSKQVAASKARKSYWSPDHKLRAIVIALPPRSYGGPESKVEIRTASGRLLAHVSYASATGAQGYGVAEAEWTANSRFFVYTLENVGGHSPWHWPTAFYSRRRHHTYSLDSTLGRLSRRSGKPWGDGAITDRLKLVTPCTVRTTGRVNKDVCAVKVRVSPTQAADERQGILGNLLTINLCRLDNVLTRADQERTHLRY